MTDTQLYVAIGIPASLFALNFLAVLAAAFWQSKRFDDMKDWFGAEIGRVDGQLRSELKRVEGEMKSDLKRIEGELKSDLKRIEGELKSDLKRIEGELKSELKRVEGVLGSKIDGLTVRVKALEDAIHSPLVKQ